MAGLSSHDTLLQTSTTTAQAPAEAGPSATNRVKKVVSEGSGAESLDFKYPKWGLLLSLLMQADKTKDRLYWWPLTWLPVIGGPRFACRSEYTPANIETTFDTL